MKTTSFVVKATDKGFSFSQEQIHPSRAAARRYANSSRESIALYDFASGQLLSMSGKK